MPIRVYYEVLNQKGTPALYSDNYAQRPAAGFQGRIFNSPDTGQIFYDTGTTWTLLADAGVGSGSLASVCANGNTTATGISITAGGLSTNDFTNTGFASSVGYVWFAGTGGQMTGTQSFFWDNNNKWLGLGTNTPTAPFDVHTTGNIGIQINNTTTADSKIAFLNADVGKWRIGNLYSGGANLFHIYNNAGSTLAMQINSSNAALFYGSLSSNSFMQTNGGLSLIHNAVPTSSGYTGIGGLTAGLSIALASGFNQTLTFPTGVAYTYTFPSATGTIALTSNLGGTTGYLPKYASGTSLGQSLIYDNGTNVGIDTNSPSNKLTISNNGNAAVAFRINDTNANASFLSLNVSNTDAAIIAGGTSAIPFDIYTGGSARLTIDNAGFVGIATSNPSAFQSAARNLVIGSGTGNCGMTFFSSSTTAGSIHFADEQTSGAASYRGYINYTHSTDSMQFGTLSVERMSITSDGSLLVGTTSNNFSSRQVNSSTTSYTYHSVRTGTGSEGHLVFSNGNGAVGSIFTNGTSTLYNATSDYRLKQDLKDYNGLQIVSAIKTYDYEWKSDKTRMYGVLAHELAEVIPYCVTGEKDAEQMQAVDYSKIVPVLVKAIQELNAKIENLN